MRLPAAVSAAARLLHVLLPDPLERSPRRWPRRRRPSSQRPLEQLVTDLRRLEGEYRRTEQAAEVPYLSHRLRALSLAYDRTLLECCRVLGLPEPQRPPWSAVERLEVESELARAGLVW